MALRARPLPPSTNGFEESSNKENPLWPVGHLPHKGERPSREPPFGRKAVRQVKPRPLVGRGWGGVFSSEMTGYQSPDPCGFPLAAIIGSASE